MGVMRILGPSGDTRVEWNPADLDEVSDVRRRFNEIVAEGYLVFELEDESMEGRQVRSFDPRAREIRAFRPLAGGSSRA